MQDCKFSLYGISNFTVIKSRSLEEYQQQQWLWNYQNTHKYELYWRSLWKLNDESWITADCVLFLQYHSFLEYYLIIQSDIKVHCPFLMSIFLSSLIISYRLFKAIWRQKFKISFKLTVNQT